MVINHSLSKKALFLLSINVIFLAISGIIIGINYYRYRVDIIYCHPTEPSDWETPDESIQLYGEIYYPAYFDSDRKYPAVILFHGYGRSLNDYYYYIQELIQLDIICFAIDFHGFGKSTGEFPSDGRYYNASFGDAMGAYLFISNYSCVDTSRILALGTSLGGGAALFLAIQNKVHNIALWYPAVGYILEGKNLSEYILPSSEVNALIFVGTEDECTRCNPNDVGFFAENNALEIYWLEGATHTDGRFYSEVSSVTKEWIIDLWDLTSPTIFQTWFSQNYLSYGIIAILVIIDVVSLIKNRRKHIFN
jgi:dienelactone hydrolase